MITLDVEVQQPYFDAIQNGTKTMEGRLAQHKYTDLQPGDILRFSNPSGTQSLNKTVAHIHRFPTFAAAFETEDFKQAIPDAGSAEDAIAVYEQFYPSSVQKQTGIVFIGLA